MARNLCCCTIFFVIVVSTLIHVGTQAATDCYWTSTLYYGNRQTTKDGTLCRRWDAFSNFKNIIPNNFPDATLYDAANFCRDPDITGRLWCFISKAGEWMSCDIAKCVNYKVSHCGRLKIEQPTILGRDVTFSFTPETNDPYALSVWERKNEVKPWARLPVGDKFTHNKHNGTYYLTVTNTVIDNTGIDAVFYRTIYYNQTVKCTMESGKLNLLDISRHPCGYVYLRTAKVREDENVEIEYYPSKTVLRNPQHYERQWTRSNTTFTPIKLKTHIYEEEKSLNDKYVLTIFSFNHSMDDQYGVYCGEGAGYTNFVSVIIPVPPSAPVFNNTQAIEECKNCIIGEDEDQFRVLCKTTGGTEPVNVTIAIGNESLETVPYPEEDGYIAFFYLHEKHHLAVITCTVSNAALTSPLSVSSHLYVILPPSRIELDVKVEERHPHYVYAICRIYDSNPACIANFGAPHGIIGSERYTKRVSKPNGAWDSVYAINLNVNEDNEGEVLQCQADCEGLTVDLRNTSALFLPYAPEIEFNISSPILNITKGEQIYVTCSAKSFPASSSSWLELSNDGRSKTRKECPSSTDCVLNIDGHSISQRRFICMTRYFQTTDQKNLTVNILEKVQEQFQDQGKTDSAEKTFIWIIVGCCLAVLIVVFIVCCVVTRRKQKAKLDADQVRANASGNGTSSSRCGGEQHGEHFNGAINECDDPEVLYSQPDKNKAAFSDTDQMRGSNLSATNSKEDQHVEGGQLLYADLGFDPTATPAKDAIAKRRATPTEYVAIDFVRTAAEQAKKDEPEEAENIYANQ